MVYVNLIILFTGEESLLGCGLDGRGRGGFSWEGAWEAPWTGQMGFEYCLVFFRVALTQVSRMEESL